MRPWKFLLPLLATSVCFAAQPDRIAGVIDSSRSASLVKSHHFQAIAQYDQGPVNPSMKLGYVVMLMTPSPAQQRALITLLAQQQDPKSANYHKWLTPQQFADQFGLSQNDVDKITTWLKSKGFHILSVGGSRNSIAFSGTAANAQSAFGSEIHYYKVDGVTHFANSTPLRIPAALNGIVETVIGLHSFLPKPALQMRGAGGARIARPSYYEPNPDFVFHNFLAPDDVATIYDIAPLYNSSITGAGVTLGIIGQTDVYLADIADFRTGFNLNPITGCDTGSTGLITSCNSTYFQYVLVGSDPGIASTCGDLEEADLDLEWSGATARDAQIVYFNAPAAFNADCTEITNGGGVNVALTAAIDPASGPVLAHVLSMSYGACEAGNQSLETLLQQANAEGITVVNSSGDAAAAACDTSPPFNEVNPPFEPAQYGFAVSYPASSPEVTAVGGTSISLANDSYPTQSSYWSTTEGPNLGTAVSYIPEQPWNDDEEFASYCHAPASGDQFCSTGDDTPGWEALSTSATAAQVQADIWISGGGGGASNCFYVNSSGVCLGAGAGPTGGGLAQPAYQKSLVVPSAPSGVRYVPDVSFLASPNFPGYIFCTPIGQLEDSSDTTSSCASGIANALNTSYVSVIGGTSVSTPVFAGIVALMSQKAGGYIGNINPTLYSLAATPSNGAFHQITSGDNNAYCAANTPSGYPSNVVCPSSGVLGFSASNSDPTTGYNLVNGLGSVDVNVLAQSFNPQYSLTVTPPSSASVPAGNSASFGLSVAPLAGATPTVNFTPSSCSGLPTGATCSFSPSGVTLNGSSSQTVTVTIATTADMALPSAAQTVTITPTGSSITTTVSLTVTATTQSFTVTPGATTYSVPAGQAASVQITVKGQNGFITSSNTTALPLNYSCTGLPSEALCTFSPSQSGVSATALTLSISTTAPTSELRKPFDRGNRIFYAMLLPGVFGIVFAAGSRGRGARLLGLIVVLGLSTLWLGACGGSSSSSQNNPGTPAGSYTVTVNATTGAPTGGTALTGSFNITLTVTQ